MSISLVIGLLTTIVSGVMAVLLLNRYRQRGGMHQLLWGLGLVLYFVGGLSEVLLELDDEVVRLRGPRTIAYNAR